jgi:hypothetical protein
VTTPDLHVSGSEALEARLIRAYTVEIPHELAARMDERMATAIEAGQSWAPRRPRIALPRLDLAHLRVPRLLRAAAIIPVLVALVMINTVSETGGGQTFFDREGGAPWRQSTKLEVTTTVDGYQATLHRAYADANLMLLGLTMTDARALGSWDFGGVSVSDSSGAKWENETATSSAAGATSDGLWWFSAMAGPAPAGRRAFTATVRINSNRGEPPMPSTFDPNARDPSNYFVPVEFHFSFELTVAGGSDTSLNVSAESQGVTITLDRIVTSPAMVRLTLHVRGAFPAGSDGWTPIAYVKHNGTDIPVGSESAALGDAGQFSTGAGVTVETSQGVADPSGEWSLTATELTGNATDPGAMWGHEVRIQGSWTLDFTLP